MCIIYFSSKCFAFFLPYYTSEDLSMRSNRSEVGRFGLTIDLIREIIQYFAIEYKVSCRFYVMPFTRKSKFLSDPTLLKASIVNGCWILLIDFSPSNEMAKWFFKNTMLIGKITLTKFFNVNPCLVKMYYAFHIWQYFANLLRIL